MTYRDPLAGEAVAAHDLARHLPEPLWDELTDRLAGLVPAGARCVDVGIGTGAVGGRLRVRGLSVLGVDANRSMLDVLAVTHPGLPVVIGDATDLPVATGGADLVVMACVLHLVAGWQRALAEAVRVATPGGVVGVNVGSMAQAGRTAISRVFLDAVTSRVTLPPITGPASSTDVADELAALGCSAVDPVRVEGHAARSVRDHIFRLEWNPFGWPAGTPQWALSEAAAVTTAWAIEEFGDIDAHSDVPVALGFTLARVP